MQREKINTRLCSAPAKQPEIHWPPARVSTVNWFTPSLWTTSLITLHNPRRLSLSNKLSAGELKGQPLIEASSPFGSVEPGS